MKPPTIFPMPILDPTIGRVRFDPIKSLWLWSLLLISLLFGLPNLTVTQTIIAATLAGITFCLGHSVGLHRGIIHRSYRTFAWFQSLLVYLFVLTGLGGPLTWARIHAVRDYWQNQSDCPDYFGFKHSLLLDFWWNLHFSFEPADDRAMHRIPSDIPCDPWLRFLEKTWPLHQLPLAAVIWVWLGPSAVASVVCGRIAVGILAHWFIGFASHAGVIAPMQSRVPAKRVPTTGSSVSFLLGKPSTTTTTPFRIPLAWV